MKKQTQNRFKNIIYLVCCVLFLTVFQSSIVKAQKTYSINLDSDVQNLKLNIYSDRFIPIDSIADKDGNIFIGIINELKHLQLSKYEEIHFLLKVGYYIRDTSDEMKCEKVFSNIKDYLAQSKSKTTTLIDINCQDILSLNSEAREYQNSINTLLPNSIYISLYKSNSMIAKMRDRAKCYLR